MYIINGYVVFCTESLYLPLKDFCLGRSTIFLKIKTINEKFLSPRDYSGIFMFKPVSGNIQLREKIIPQEKFVPVFVDAKPSENLEPSSRKTLCFIAILTSHMNGVPKLKGYKNTKRTKKLDSAKKITKYLKGGDLEVDAIGIVGRTDGQYIHWACDSINRSREMLNASWVVNDKAPTHLAWKDYQIHRSDVLGLSIYAGLMPIIALRATSLASHDPTRRYKLCLDALPNNSNLGMDFMKAMSEEREIASMWKQNLELGGHFEIGTLDKWMGDDGKWHPGKKHPNSILVDWMAVGCMAKSNPKQLQAEGDYTSEEIQIFAKMWDSAFSQSIIDLDDKEYMKKVKEHWEIVNKDNDGA